MDLFGVKEAPESFFFFFFFNFDVLEIELK